MIQSECIIIFTLFGQSITLTDLPHMRTTYMPGVILLITLSVPRYTRVPFMLKTSAGAKLLVMTMEPLFTDT